MNLLRAFIAIEIPTAIHQKLESRLEALKKQPGGAVRWVKISNIHLTLKFLGDIEPARLDRLAGCLQKAVDRHVTFELQAGGFGAFPSLNRPRVFWCGLSNAPELNSLQQLVEKAAAASGCPAEERPFSPHLTVGRSNDRADPASLWDIAEQFRRLPAEPLGTFRVDRLVVFRSQLAAGGSIYTPLHTILFGGAARV